MINIREMTSEELEQGHVCTIPQRKCDPHIIISVIRQPRRGGVWASDGQGESHTGHMMCALAWQISQD